MPAVAARSASSRAAAPARRSAPVRRAPVSRPRPVARTADVVGGVAEWGLVHRLTRGRLWIGVLAVLLVGIVAINVMALSFSAASSKTASNADELKRLNSAARAQIAAGLSSDKVQQQAEQSGLHVPPAGSIRYLKPSADDAAKAARRLTDGSITVDDGTAAATESTATPVVTADPAIDPLTGAPLASDPTLDATTTTAATTP
jgi:hypothetical protein